MNINQNATLEYEQGKNEAIAAYTGEFNASGSFNKAYVDNEMYNKVLNRTEDATVEFLFTNGESGDDLKSIKLIGTGFGPSQHGSSVTPVNPIFEDVNWRIRKMTVEAMNDASGAP